MKKIVFLTGTRADYGKMKALMKTIDNSNEFECHIFITGMHTLSRYGSTYKEVEKDCFKNIYTFINQTIHTKMDLVLSNTILGFSNYVNELKPDMIVIHGDRVEALAGAIVGSLNNILVAHIEGGEVSGTIDELIRHSVTKLSHVHFVANNEAKNRVLQMGEKKESIFVIGSPDIDIMLSASLPSLSSTKDRYEILFDRYSIFIYHSVTTEISNLRNDIKQVVDALIESQKNYVVIYPNNDEGSEIILEEYKRFKDNKKFKIFPSVRFEYFLTLLKNCDSIIGNSSTGIRESEIYGISSINIGSRQSNRCKSQGIIDVDNEKGDILKAIAKVNELELEPAFKFGDGKSSDRFYTILKNDKVWKINHQKIFIDIDNI